MRARYPALILLCSLCAGAMTGPPSPAAAAPRTANRSKVPPKKAPLKAMTLEKPMPFNFRLPEGRTAAGVQHALVAKVARRKLTLVDVDGDGRFDEAGVDGWTLGNYAYLLPYEQPFLFGTVVVEVALQPGHKSLLWSAASMPGNRGQLQELALINFIRMRNGVPPAAYDKTLSEACRLHTNYMARNGLVHAEDARKTGYTPEGAQAGANSNIAQGWRGAGVGAFQQFYHRRTVSDPATRRMGFGTTGSFCCVDGLSDQVQRPWTWPLIIPAPGSRNHPVDYDHGEMPRPVPRTPPAGLPITLRWPRGTSIEGVRAKVFDAHDTRIEALVSSPEKPANDSMPDNNDSICIIPRSVLRPGTQYRVEVKAQVDGKPYERTFVFETTKRSKR